MYIEQLLKERDMERLAVTRAATQAEEAERQVDMLKQELRQVNSLFLIFSYFCVTFIPSAIIYIAVYTSLNQHNLFTINSF